jgi:hypothetical protein
MRVFIPGLQPLSCGAGYEHRDRRRLAVFAKRMGVAMPSSLNLDLHPFP